MTTNVFYYCRQGHMTRLRYTLCPFCNQPFVGEVQAVQKTAPQPDVAPIGFARPHPWQLTRHDWAVLKAVGIDPQQERPVYR